MDSSRRMNRVTGQQLGRSGRSRLAERRSWRSRPGKTVSNLMLVLAGIAALGLAGYASRRMFEGNTAGPVGSYSTHKVVKGDLLVTVTEDGTVESAKNVDVKCQVAGGSAILWIVKDGTEVQAGDKLVELDSSTIDDTMNTQRIAYNKAKTTMIQADKNLQVAEISVKEYLEGTFVQSLETAETNITIAEENLRSAKNSLEYSEKMFQRGYISQLELESQQFSVKRSELELNSAQTAKKVLEEFTKAKTLEDLQSKVETARATVESERAAFQLEEGKLKRLETQKENCVIVAPQGGMVVYANEQSGRGGGGGQQATTIEEGAAVRERQTILRLPDLSQMQVKVTVHESKIEELEVGMRARITVQGRDLQGKVVSIGNQPEPTGWFQGNVKEYATLVRIDGKPDDLKPGMTAQVEILVAHLKDVISVPVSAVVEQRGEFFCWVKDSSGRPVRRQLGLGMTNDQFVEVKQGLELGEEVVRNPRGVIAEARADGDEKEEKDNIESKFGPAGEASSSGPGRDGKGPDGGPAGAPGGKGPDEKGPGGQAADGRGGGGAGGGDSAGGQRRGNLMDMDRDGDGKVSREEAPEQMQSFFDRADGNSDGFIDKAEAAALRSRMQGGGGPGGGGPGGGGSP